MKNKLYKQSGFLTLEILIAMTVLILMLAVVVMVSFGNQSMVANSQSNAEALNIAQGLLEKAQADSRKDFNLVNPISSITSSDGFVSSIDVKQIDYFTKLVTATVKFPEDNGINGSTILSSIITNFNNAVGGDTCSSVILPDTETWKNPNIKEKFSDLSSLASISDNYPITDIDAYRDKLYVAIGKTTSLTAPTFFVFNIDDSDISNPKLTSEGFIDNDGTKQSGINAVTVSEDTASQTTYAYVAAAGTTKQLQVIDVSTNLPIVKPNSLTVTGGSAGNSIFYKNGYIYLGLKSSTTGPEFHIIDVHKPTSSLSEVGHWPENGSLGHDINSIFVSGRYAYLATPDSRNLIVLNISNVSAPTLAGSYDDGGSNNGKSIFAVGDTLYLGRTEGGTELSVLNESDPTVTPPVFDSDSTINKSIDGIFVRGKLNSQTLQIPEALAFLLTPSNFTVMNVSDSTNMSPWGSEPLPSGTFGSSLFEPVFDCEGNNFFIGSNDTSNNGHISVVTP